jgi:hypothetical protein
MPRPCTGAAKWRDDQPDVILPPNLKTLRLFNCASARPLLALAALEVLSISKHCEIPAIELQSLSALRCLTCVELGYNNVLSHDYYDADVTAQEGSASWGFFPGQRELWSDNMHFSPLSDVLQRLAALTNLTRLVYRCNID